MHAITLSTELAMSAGSAQLALQHGGRTLLMISMALFLSYLLFMIGAVTVSGVMSSVRSRRARTRTREALSGATAAPARPGPAWSAERAPELRDVRV
ncbi:hypothetical protein [Kocuria rosea]|uniref:hypothetical protein n=1 Tax=Kocuria rosea TaxID=1275 RepID=UPI00203B9B37|nr:hypothetical protein [Kocuria rosea]MCM3687853.1 hypothetical protein [Kocuria rosea]